MPATDFVSRSQALVAAGQYQEAVKICRLGLLAKPSDVAGRLILGQALLALRRYDEALAEMRVAVDSEPGNAGAHQIRGEALLRKGDGFAAVEALERARGLAHGDPTIAALLAEARNLVATEGGRATLPPGNAELDGNTKHYPSHRGGEVDGGGRSGTFTKPVALKGGAERRSTDRVSSPSIEHLAVGDRSGTVEVDPERDGLGDDDDGLGELIEPPSFTAPTGSSSIIIDDADLVEVDPEDNGRPARRDNAAVSEPARGPAPAAAAPRGPAPVVPLFGGSEPTRGGRPRPTGPATLGRPAATAPRPGPSTGPAPRGGAVAPAAAPVAPPASRSRAPAAAAPRPPDDDGHGMQNTAMRTAEWGADEMSSGNTRQRRLPVPPPADHGDAPTVPRPIVDPAAEPSRPVAPIDPRGVRDHRSPPGIRPLDRFEEESSVAGRGHHPRLAALASGPLGPLNTPPPELTPPGPNTPGAPLGGGFGPPPGGQPGFGPPPGGQPGFGPPPGAQPGFGPPPGASREPVLVLPPQARTAVPFHVSAVKPTMMMAVEGTAPAGPALPPEDPGRRPPGPSQPPPYAPMPGGPHLSQAELMRMMGPGPLPPARRSPLVLGLWATVTVAIIGTGVLAGFKIRALRLDKQIAASRRGAEDAAATDTWLGWRAARDRLAGIYRASPRAEYRAALARAEAVLAADFVDDLDRARAAVAGLGGKGGKDGALARAYLALAQGDPAAATAAAEAAGGRDEPAIALVLARAALLDGRAADAAGLAQTAIERGRRPAALLVLCEAERLRKRWSEATKACAEVETVVPGHPAAVVGRARIAAASGAARVEPGAWTTALEAVIAEAARPEVEQKLGVSRGQEAWADLALAEVQLAAGDTARARSAIQRADAVKVDSRELRAARAEIRLALGDVEQARELASAGLVTWPGSLALIVVRARATLATYNLDGAARELDKVEGAAINASVDALVTRGEINLARGQLDDAAKDLDAALGKAPDFEQAVVARARLDLARGDYQAAVARVESRVGPETPPRVAVVYAAAQRGKGQLDLARRALVTVLDDPPGPVTGLAHLEAARIERDAGNYAGARTEYGKAGGMLASSEVRIEAALLAIDFGDAGGGRETLEPLASEPNADGVLLVEAARAQILCGKLDEAQALLERAGSAASRPEATLARERGRLALRRRDAAQAIPALQRAVDLAPDDLEAWLMLVDAYLVGDNTAGAQRIDSEFKRTFPNRPERFLSAGRVAMKAGDFAEARGAFDEARKGLVRASRRVQADANSWLGQAHFAGGEVGAARASLVEATRLDPFNADAQAMLGYVLQAAGDAAGAVDAFRKARQLDPGNVDLDALLGELLASRNPREAITLLDAYLRKQPSGDYAEQARATLARLRR